MIGLHNWIQMYLEERAGHFQYEGFVRPNQVSLSADSRQDQCVMRFISGD